MEHAPLVQINHWHCVTFTCRFSAGAERETTFTLSPGFRKAINFPDDKQLVLGFATPITFSSDNRTDYGLFFYLSFEHNVFKHTRPPR